jgi:hypothetical protein
MTLLKYDFNFIFIRSLFRELNWTDHLGSRFSCMSPKPFALH